MPRSFMGIEQPDGQTLCEAEGGCTHYGRPNICEGDGQYHRHGMVHTLATDKTRGGLKWLCGGHAKAEEQAWIDSRAKREA